MNMGTHLSGELPATRVAASFDSASEAVTAAHLVESLPDMHRRQVRVVQWTPEMAQYGLPPASIDASAADEGTPGPWTVVVHPFSRDQRNAAIRVLRQTVSRQAVAA